MKWWKANFCKVGSNWFLPLDEKSDLFWKHWEIFLWKASKVSMCCNCLLVWALHFKFVGFSPSFCALPLTLITQPCCLMDNIKYRLIEAELVENVETIREWKSERRLTFSRLQTSWESPTRFDKSQCCASLHNSALTSIVLVVWKWPWWEYLHHRNWQTLQNRVLSLLQRTGSSLLYICNIQPNELSIYSGFYLPAFIFSCMIVCFHNSLNKY